MTDTPRPRRSMLYMPASNARAVDKARELPVDGVILDLEDAVAPDDKIDARAAAVRALQADYGHRELVVRVNGPDTPWFADDIDAVCGSEADALLVPKVESAAQVRSLSERIDRLAKPGLALWIMVETPAAVLDIASIAATARDTRLGGLVLGFNDLAKEMGASPGADRAMFYAVMVATVMAARANGLVPLDSVYNDFRDAGGLDGECAQAAAFGFDGKTLIHPAQIEAANRAFAPSPAALDDARAIVAAFDRPENAGKGVITIDGKMTELLHLEQARALIARADAIAARSG